MVIRVYGQEVSCARAEKGADFIRAYDAVGNCVFSADSIADFSGYVLEGGSWSQPELTDTARIEELEDLVAELLFGGDGE